MVFKRSGSNRHSEMGAYLIEVAIILPLVIGFMFAAIDVARITAGYSAVRMATALGSRWAVGVNRVRWQVFHDLWTSQDANGLIPISALSTTVETYYKLGINNIDFYTTDQFDSTTKLSDLYEMEFRAIAYGNDIVRRSLGEVIYPCRDQPGCLACFTIRRASATLAEDFTQGNSETGRTMNFPVKMLGLRCDYNVPITSSSVSLGWFPPFITVRSTAFVPISDYANIYYDRQD